MVISSTWRCTLRITRVDGTDSFSLVAPMMYWVYTLRTLKKTTCELFYLKGKYFLSKLRHMFGPNLGCGWCDCPMWPSYTLASTWQVKEDRCTVMFTSWTSLLKRYASNTSNTLMSSDYLWRSRSQPFQLPLTWHLWRHIINREPVTSYY